MADKVAGRNEYLGVVKVLSTSTSQKARFYADNVRHAVDKLCAISGVKSTLELHEFEILEVLDGGRGYRPIATKLANKGRASTFSTPSPLPPRVEPKQEVMDRVNNSAAVANVSTTSPPPAAKPDEIPYTPYTLKVDV